MEDYIDWSKVPEGYDWAAVDEMPGKGKHTFAYRHKPKIESGLMYEGFYDGLNFKIIDDAIIGPLPPWHESLRQRPKKDAS